MEPILDAFRREIALQEACPACLGTIDPGWACVRCGYDASPLLYPPAEPPPAPRCKACKADLTPCDVCGIDYCPSHVPCPPCCPKCGSRP